jgi:hypothetical protein
MTGPGCDHEEARSESTEAFQNFAMHPHADLLDVQLVACIGR